ncbi:MAG: TetR/AcrR family transcriptional regulator [Acidocella sp.]|nr:TetR/AcrR family transcriptional regulator [Acidocella sp.]
MLNEMEPDEHAHNRASLAGPSARSRNNHLKHQHILAVARDLFFANGFSATSMEAVAKEAAVGKATLYEMFPNKIELLRAIITIELDKRADRMVFDEISPGHLRAALARFAHALIDLLLSAQNVAIYRIVSSEAPRHPELGRFFYENGPARAIGLLADYLTTVMEKGLLQHGNPRLVAAQFIGLIRADMQTRSLFGVDEDILRTERVLIVESGVDVFLRAYAR